MNKNIITYLNENKEQYAKEALIAELKKAGYAEGDIAEGIAQVFGLPDPAAKTSFWNFKDKKVYTKASEKWADFLFGFFAPDLVGYASVISIFYLSGSRVSFAGLWFFLAEIVVAIYFFNRRSFISYGIIASAIVLPIITNFFFAARFAYIHF